jgi:hypothetical protein
MYRIRASLCTQAGKHAHTVSPTATSARAIAHTCTWTRNSHLHAHSLLATTTHREYERTRYMFDTDATFHFEMSALNVGLAVFDG